MPWALAGLAILVWAVPLQIGFYRRSPITDIPVYRHVADLMLDGLVPYRDFFLEYPPLAAGLFAGAGLVPGNYTAVFQVAMAACLVATVLGVLASARALGLSPARQAAAGGAVAVSPLLIGNLVETRFDLALAALLAWMLYAAVAGRFRLMWVLFAAAVLLKLVPLALLPVLVLHQRHRQDLRGALRGAAGSLAAVAVVAAPFVALSPSGMWDMIDYHLSRPLQIESLGAAYLLGLHVIADVPVRVVNAAGSQGLDGRGPDALAAISTVILVAGIVAIAVTLALLQRRAAPPADGRLLVAAWAASSAMVLVGGKVLSPQFLVWLLPAVFLVTGRYGLATFGIAAAAMLLTLAYFPNNYFDLVALGRAEIGILVLRDLVLVALVAAAWPRPAVGRPPTEVLPTRGEDAGRRPERAVAARFLAD
jgi:glycosyl transferase family 87